MASIESCQYDIKRYQNLKKNIKSIISQLESSNNNYDELEKTINKVYQVDSDSTVLANRVQNLQKDVQKTSNYLKYTVTPAIDSAINRLKQKMAELAATKQE